MVRALATALLVLVCSSPVAFAQDAAARRATRAIHAQDKEILHRITTRIEYDKKLDGSTVKVEVRPGGAVTLSGSVMSAVAKGWAVELVENTTGVSSVVDELAVVKDVKVYEVGRATSVIEVVPPIRVPIESKVIVKP